MNVFLHYKLQNLNEFTNELIGLHQLYEKKAYGIEIRLKDLMDDSIEYYRHVGESKEELQINELKSYLLTAAAGYNPQTREKVRTMKRANLMLAVFHCLSGLGEYLQVSLSKVNKKLNEAQELLGNLILGLIKSGAIDINEIQNYNSVDNCEILWNDLKKDNQIKLIDKNLKLNLVSQDIYILLDNILTKMNS